MRKNEPATYDEIVGHDEAKGWCRRQISSGLTASVIFYGPDGVDGNTLARVHGRSLLCESPTASGSRCCACPSCQIFERGQRHPDYFELSLRRVEKVATLIETLRFRLSLDQRRVAILRDAHGLSLAAWDLLARVLDETPPLAVFVFVTTAVEKLPRAIVSRCVALELHRIDFEGSVRHLRSICQAESILAEPAALHLIAERAGGLVLDLVQTLEGVAEQDGIVTEEGVRRFLKLDYVNTLARFMRCVVDGNLQGQLDAVGEWNQLPEKKARAIWEFMVSLQQRDLGLRRSHFVMDMIAPGDAEAILSAIGIKSREAKFSRGAFWQALVDHWTPGERTTDVDLRAKLIKFHGIINAPTPPTLSPTRPSSQEPSSGGFRLRRPRRPRPAIASRPEPSAGRAYLSKEQLRKLFDAASFMVQEYGHLLNAGIVVAHERLGISETRVGVDLISELVHELGMAVKRWAGEPLHSLYVHDCGERIGFATTLVAYIPRDLADDVDKWLFDDFLPTACKRLQLPAAVDLRAAVHLRVTAYESVEWQLRRHQHLIRLLCRSANPEIYVSHRGERPALIDVLRIPRLLRQTFRPVHVAQRWRVSETIGSGVRAKMRADGLAALSAFTDEAWDELWKDWELKEHLDRKWEREERDKARAIVDVKWSARAGELQERARLAELEQLRSSWSADPRERRRSWTVWWKR